MLQILIQGQKVTKSEQWPKCHKFWSKDKKLQNLNNDHNFHVCSKVNSYTFWTMTKMSKILIYGKMLQNLNIDQNVTNSDQRSKITKMAQWPKCHIFWSKVKKLQNLNNDQNVAYSDQNSKSYRMWLMTKMSKILINCQKVTKSEQWPKCQML